MSGWVAGATVVGAIGGSLISANASKKASNAQQRSAQSGIAQQNKQFEAIQKLLAPYSQAGTGALDAQQDLLGLNGNSSQRQAINGIQNSAQFKSLARQGEMGILQNASATGGLRGGNTQGALAQFRPALLNGLIDQQYQRLGGLTSIGQNAAAGVGNAGMNTGNQITSLLQQQGAAQAGNALAQGQAGASMVNGIASGIGTIAGAGGFNRPSNFLNNNTGILNQGVTPNELYGAF
jgi:hypothetical protein